MYNPTKWQDEVKDTDTGELIQEGTNLSAVNLNNMEDGISDANIATMLTMIFTRLSVE